MPIERAPAGSVPSARDSSTEDLRPTAPARSDWGIAALLALLVGCLYALTFQTRWFGDGPGLATMHALGTGERYYHLLYLPACDLVQRVLGLADPFLAPRLLSIVPAALGLGLCHVVLRATGARAPAALVALALLALAPSLWFFGTTVEIHALHFAMVAFVAAVTLLAPWRRPALALLLVAAAFPLLYWSHQASFTLGPGWVLLVQYARARHGRRFSSRALVLGVGPLLLAALLAAVGVSYLVRFGSLATAWQDVRAQIALQDVQGGIGTSGSTWRDEWLLPLGVLVPLAALGFAHLRREPLLAAATAALLLVPAAFFLWWGVTEMGGYFLGSAPFLLVPVTRLFAAPRRNGLRLSLALALVLVACQGWLGATRKAAFDEGWDPARRVELVREALDEQGLLVTSVDFAPNIACTLPRVKEFSLTVMLRNACAREQRLLGPAELRAHAQRILPPLFRRHARIVVEVGYARAREEELIPAFRLGLAAIEEMLREQYVVRAIDDPYWPLLVLERPR